MKNIFHFVSFFAIFMMSSCVAKRDRTIAIDVLLLLPQNLSEEAILLNTAILKNNPDNFTLDKDHVPHITLLQCYVRQSDLPKITMALNGLYNMIENESLWANELQYKKDQPQSFASIGIEKSSALLAIHERAIALVQPYITTGGSQNAFIPTKDGSPIDQFTIDYIPKFVSNYSYENYNPHISLGVSETSVLHYLEKNEFREMKFKAPAVAVYQLGKYGTARKLLWKSE
ncbi:hypothetical protein Q73A0000_00280 [Kaistella flava (ex Peng et al. 2021)]|uniref:2'-5' RNA ligase n=1 Tax=Kaistella flava (ex Peng et al. 2021) TaxID=2038776 RepID=A0A7M2Y630_9FLAO|nr:hypothetical protein [Kaistella flava (ex Peng et al. 2021)]QOW08892.1 hypothetical protein Q73A0000_00280 [Kaistella flava (ex Peng et al. 2021)]